MLHKIATLITLAVLCSADTRYNNQDKIEDVRGGVTLQVTYPPDLVSSFEKSGKLTTKLGNFGHIQYGTAITCTLAYDPDNEQGC